MSHSPQFFQQEVWGQGEEVSRVEGRVYEDAKRPSQGKTQPTRFGRQAVKRCNLSAEEKEASKDTFSAGHSNHLIQNLYLDPKGAQATKGVNTYEPNAAFADNKTMKTASLIAVGASWF